MSRDPGILHDEICSKLDQIIEILKYSKISPSTYSTLTEIPTGTQVCTCSGSYSVSGRCTKCGLPKATPTLELEKERM